MAPDKKKIAAMIIMGMKKKPGGMPGSSDSSSPEVSESKDEDMGQDDDSGDESDTMTAGKEVMDALKMGDIKGFVQSMSSLIKLCEQDEPEDYQEQEQ